MAAMREIALLMTAVNAKVRAEVAAMAAVRAAALAATALRAMLMATAEVWPTAAAIVAVGQWH